MSIVLYKNDLVCYCSFSLKEVKHLNNFEKKMKTTTHALLYNEEVISFLFIFIEK